MKKGMIKQLKIAVITVMFSLFVVSWVNAQQIDNRLWGTWSLDTIELTKDGVPRQYTLETLLADKSNLPRNMFTWLYFFGDQIGVHSTETEFVPAVDVSLKGNFTTNDGLLIVTMYEESPRTFTYEIEDDLLIIKYTEGDVQFYLVYKLLHKIERS